VCIISNITKTLGIAVQIDLFPETLCFCQPVDKVAHLPADPHVSLVIVWSQDFLPQVRVHFGFCTIPLVSVSEKTVQNSYTAKFLDLKRKYTIKNCQGTQNLGANDLQGEG